MRVLRLIVYEGAPDWVQDTLSKSLPDGIKKCLSRGCIKVVTLGALPDPVELVLKIKEKEEGGI